MGKEMDIIVEYTDNSQQIKAGMEDAVLKALEECGLAAEGYAKELCPVGTPESTGIPGYIGGTLRNSITHVVDGQERAVYIGSNVEYAAYVELGTGIYADGGRKTPWVYQDEEGNWHKTSGQKPQPYLKPAITDHRDEYKRIIEDNLKE